MSFALLSGLAVSASIGAADDEIDKLVAESNRAYNTGRYKDGLAAAEHITALSRERYGESDPRYAGALNAEATFLQLTGSLDRAELLMRQSLAIDEAALGPDAPQVATRRANLAVVLLDKDQAAEAADLLNEAVVSIERQPNNADRGPALSNFAAALERLNRLDQAERLYLSAVAALREHPGANDTRLAIALGNLGILYKKQHRLTEARARLEEAVALLERLSTPAEPNPRLATALNNLATLWEDGGDYAAAESLYRRAIDLDRAVFGPDNPRLATRYNNVGNMFINEARYDDALREIKEALRIDRAAYGDDHPLVAHVLLTGARLFAAQKNWEAAHSLISRSAEIMVEANARRDLTPGHVEAGRDIPDVSLSQIVFASFLQISGEWPWTDTSQFGRLAGPAFDIAQRLVTPAAAAAIARIAARYASGNPALADKVRRQQELTEKWNQAEAAIIAQLALPSDRVDREAVAGSRKQQAQLEQELKSLSAELGQGSQRYAGLAAGKVLTIARVQELLASDEALVYFADDAVHIHAFFITKQNAAWMPLPLTSATIAEHVDALRCGLDAGLWLGDAADRCFRLLGVNYTEDDLQRGEELPFNLDRAHELYQALFGTLGSRLNGKRLILVPSGALAKLPFQVLLTDGADNSLPRAERYRRAPWLIRRHPVAVLPSVASLEALRTDVPQGRARQPFFGVGDPLLEGPPGDPQVRALAELARSKSSCGAPQPESGVMRVSAQASRSGIATAKSVRELMPLPDTADELCAIAAAFDVLGDNVLLGSRATPAAVRDRSSDGRLGNFAVVQFATHGLTSGELAGLEEPALALTPDENSDGLFTASDIAALRLNADWVVLSACNTAAGTGGDNEAFAGLARAFFLAGARALLVSHWPVYSQAALALTTGAFKALKTEPSIGRAEALRRSMLALIDQGGISATPDYWAPFVVLGER